MCTLGLSHFMRGKGISNKAVGRSVDLGEVRKNRRSFSKKDLASISAKILGGRGINYPSPKHSMFWRPCQIANSSLKALIACSPFRPLFLEKTFSHVADRDTGIRKPCKTAGLPYFDRQVFTALMRTYLFALNIPHFRIRHINKISK